MAAEYDDLDVQSASDTPGATYANQIRANQEALIEPPATKWVTPLSLNAGWTTFVPTGSKTRLTLLSVKVGGTQPGVSAPIGGYLYQTDAGGGLTAGTEPWRDSTNDTSSGTYTNVDSAGETYSRSNAFVVPRDGLYMIGASCFLAGAYETQLEILTTGADYRPARDQVPNGGYATAVGTAYLTTSDYFTVEAYHTAGATREVYDAQMWAVRLSRTPS